ncbi:PREDICTED: LOW QUALITY PROTEIN: uncharacterized protein LOC107534259 [Miniopterus natalensis]|uniref:LOW QUALITY PROTEIN: uncharacterized protein LOC107534259 n=1 Tax=Miniopterus natalensis TaxID=291302 RepID=UPI0007A6C075|nr:PREDICTED: LOW QUALITY PROTEIN: uncharacterized protein LOC107534259 [Miniopterus natalensis]
MDREADRLDLRGRVANPEENPGVHISSFPAVPDHSIIMPRGHKSKKRPQARSETQSCGNAQAAAAAEEESTPSSSPQCEGISQGKPGAGSCSSSQGPPSAPTTTTTSEAASCPGSDEASKGQEDDGAESSEAPLLSEFSEADDFKNKAVSLELFLLYKYKMRQPILKDDMLNIVGEDYQSQFPEMFKTACEQIEIFFALDIEEVDSTRHSYALVSKLKLPNNGRVRAGRGLPKTGLLMHILGMIFINGNRVPEEEIWNDLRLMHVYPRRKHFVFGEPKKLITQDFVRLKYLECHQVPGSDPPRYEFMWGPKAHLETSKMKVLEFWAKINDTLPSAFPSCYEEALRDEEESPSHRSSQGCHYCTDPCTLQGHGQQNHSTLREVQGSSSYRPGHHITCPGLSAVAAASPSHIIPGTNPFSVRHRSQRHKTQNQQASQDEAKSGRMFEAAAPIEEEPPSSSSSVLEGNPQHSSATEPTSCSQGSCRAPTTSITSSVAFHTKSEGSQDEEHSPSSEVLPPENPGCDPLSMEVAVLQKFILHKYRMKQPILGEDMLNTVDQKYQHQFPEILKKASESIEVLFAVDLKEVDSTKHSYDLVSKLKLPNSGRVRAGRGFPKTGLLMNILGMIFLNGNRASENEIWEFLNAMRVFPGRKHYIYGEPRKLITKDLVKLKYLEYRQVPHSDPPCYEFLWGPKAYSETSKMKVLEFWAKLSDTVPSAFTSPYKEALREEVERAQARWPPEAGTSATGRE